MHIHEILVLCGLATAGFACQWFAWRLRLPAILFLLGAGIPLFSAEGSEHPLRLIDSAASDNGFVQVRYAVQSVNA